MTTIYDLRYDTIDKAMSSWEMARQYFGTEEELGMKIMLNLFRASPECKTVFGFQEDQDVEDIPLARMGVFVHSKKIIEMLDGTIAMLGPDMEMLEKVLAEQGIRHERRGLSKRHFVALGDAVRKTLLEILDTKYYGKAVDVAWVELFNAFANEMAKAMMSSGSGHSSRSSSRAKNHGNQSSQRVNPSKNLSPSTQKQTSLGVRCYASPPRGSASGL